MQNFNFLPQNLRMLEGESIHDYYLNILDIVNAFDSLGEKISDEKLVRKILRSLPKRFDMKVTAIEEAHDISGMKVDELVSSLQNFELVIDNRTEKKDKSVAFTSNTENDVVLGDSASDEDLSENLVMLRRQFNKILKHVNRRPSPNGQNIGFNNDLQTSKEKNVRSDENNNLYKGVQCHECEGYGHIRPECATFLKKQKKSLTVSWSEESEKDMENEFTKHVAALTGRVLSDDESCDKDLAYDELTITYKKLNDRNTNTCKKQLEEQKHHQSIGGRKDWSSRKNL